MPIFLNSLKTFCGCKISFESSRKSFPLRNLIAGVKTLEEKIGLPAKPKKPLTPYFRYVQQIRPKIITEHPHASIVEVVKIASKQWETLDLKLKQKLQDEYKRDQISYIEIKTNYESNLTEKQKAELKQLKHEILEAKERKIIKKRIKELGRPKKPASAFLQYLIEQRTKNIQTCGETYKEWHSKITKRWSEMTDAAKSPYIEKAKEELDKYRKEMCIWEEKMIKLGHIDVVRQEALIDPQELSPKIK